MATRRPWLWRLLVFLPGFASLATSADQEMAPQELVDIIPDVDRRLRSEEMEDIAHVLDTLVVYKRGPCTVSTELPYPLSRETYEYVAERVLHPLRQQLIEEAHLQSFYRTCHIVTTQQLTASGPLLSAYLPGSDPMIQGMIVNTLGSINATETVADIVPLLKSASESVHKAALRVLVQFRAKEVIPYVREQLRNDNPYIRCQAIRDLMEVDAQEEIPEIARMLSDSNLDNRDWALNALVKFDARDYLPRVRDLVTDAGRDHTRSHAIAVAIYLGGEDMIPLAIQELTAEDVSRRSRMADFLVELQVKPIVPACIEVLKSNCVIGGETKNECVVSGNLFDLLTELEASDAVPVLVEYARTEKNSFRSQAVIALGRLRARPAVPELLKMLELSEHPTAGEKSLATKAAVALARIGEPSTWPALISYCENPDRGNPGAVLAELNYWVNPELYTKIRSTNVTGIYQASMDETVAAFSQQTGISVVVHPPDLNAKPDVGSRGRGKRGCGAGFCDDIYGNALVRVVHELESSTPPVWIPYAIALQEGEVHVLPLQDAVRWWRETILSGMDPP